MSDQDDVNIGSSLLGYGPSCIFVLLLALVSRVRQQTVACHKFDKNVKRRPRGEDCVFIGHCV